MRIRILPYKIGSESARVIARELGILRCNPRNTRFKPKQKDLIINWGTSSSPFIYHSNTFINHPIAVYNSANKLTALRRMQEQSVSVIPFTTNKEDAAQWIEDGSYVYIRKLLNSYGGKGITIVHSTAVLPEAPLYTKGIKIRREYRVHVFRGKVIDYAQKRKRFDAPDTDDYIRNHAHGWVFVRQGFDRIGEVEQQAIAAVEALDLDFGAVDIITEKYTGKAYVLEVNCAPGMKEGSTTLKRYVEAFKEHINATSIQN